MTTREPRKLNLQEGEDHPFDKYGGVWVKEPPEDAGSLGGPLNVNLSIILDLFTTLSDEELQMFHNFYVVAEVQRLDDYGSDYEKVAPLDGVPVERVEPNNPQGISTYACETKPDHNLFTQAGLYIYKFQLRHQRKLGGEEQITDEEFHTAGFWITP